MPPEDSSSQSFVRFNRGQYVFSRPSDANLPGRHGFVTNDSLLLKIKMMQRLLRPENESSYFSVNAKKGGGERVGITFLNFFYPTLKKN